jgi:transcriptional regulator with XRE-family HTH domain
LDYNKIKHFCDLHRISIPQLAAEIGMTKKGLYLAMENRSLKIDTLEKIADALDVSVLEFFEDDSMNLMRLKVALLNEVDELKKHISLIDDKLQTRQTIINLVLFQLKTIIARHKNLVLEKGELSKLGYENLEEFLSESLESINAILDTVKVSNAYTSDIPGRPVLSYSNNIEIPDEHQNEDKIQPTVT